MVNVFYPQETSNLGEGHYIIFDVIEHKKTTFGKQLFNDFDES